MPEPISSTSVLARWAVAASRKHLPPDVEHHARRALLDFLAAALAGARSPAARRVQEYLVAVESPGAVQILGTRRRVSSSLAAFANGTAAHGLEIDDGYTPGAFHPGAPVVAAALAAAEAHGADMERLLLSISLGFEVSCRLAEAGHPATWARGFHNTPLAGVFGSAVAVAVLLEADEEQMLSALGLAGSHAGGLFEFLGTGAEVKRLHAGKAARDGLICAELAIRGLTGPATVLEGKNGYDRAFADGHLDHTQLVDGLGDSWRMLRTYIKPYPCCRHLHAPIDAALALVRDHALQVEEIEAIEVATHPVAAEHRLHRFDDLLDAQMSIPYAVAVTILHGAPSLEHFSAEYRTDSHLRRLAAKVEVSVDEYCTSNYPELRPAIVRISMPGKVLEHRVDLPLGEPGAPIDDQGLEDKFRALTRTVCGQRSIDEVVELVWSGTGSLSPLLQATASSQGKLTEPAG